MIKLYMKNREIIAEKEQVDILINAGWSLEKPSEKNPPMGSTVRKKTAKKARQAKAKTED